MIEKKPTWLKAVYNPNEKYKGIADLLKKYSLNTVCDQASCPNSGECYNKGTATFMLLGKNCTRNCSFCNVTKALPECVNSDEPKNIAKAVSELKLKHVVITSVTRDDLSDGGAEHFAQTVNEIRNLNPLVSIEVLIPDFKGSTVSLKKVLDSKPDVLNHNVETIARLYPDVRPNAKYETSLSLLKNVKLLTKQDEIATKSGFMVGLGETMEEVEILLNDLKNHDCDIVTIGQYLRPSKNHYPVYEYVKPEIFAEYKRIALSLGFAHVESGPLVRSSYNAHEEMLSIKMFRQK